MALLLLATTFGVAIFVQRVAVSTRLYFYAATYSYLPPRIAYSKTNRTLTLEVEVQVSEGPLSNPLPTTGVDCNEANDVW